MKRNIGLLPAIVVAIVLSLGFLVSTAGAQVDHIVIAAGTDEDHALQAITNEQDAAKKTAMYEEFVQKFSSNPQAVAYGNWQISQTYQQTADLQKALDYGDKALVGSPRNIDILVSQANIAQQAKNSARLMDYVSHGGTVCQSISKQSKPEGMSDDDFAEKLGQEKSSAQSSCEFFETMGLNVISAENDPKVRMDCIDKFSAGFPESKYQDTVSSLAMQSLSELKDNTRLLAYGQKSLASNPNSIPALLLLANYYSEEGKPGSTVKAITYCQKTIEVAKADAPDADKSRKLAAGAAHSTIGWAYLKQEKTASSIPELRAASALLKGQDDQQYARALYGLGFAYGKLNKLTESREVLTEAVKIPGPLQAMSQDLLTKVNSARAKGK